MCEKKHPITFVCIAFIHDGHLHAKRKEIAHHYVTTWFLVDVFASFPFEQTTTSTCACKRFRFGHLRFGPVHLFFIAWFAYVFTESWLYFSFIANPLALNKSDRKAIKLWKVLKLARLLRLGKLIKYMRSFIRFRYGLGQRRHDTVNKLCF